MRAGGSIFLAYYAVLTSAPDRAMEDSVVLHVWPRVFDEARAQQMGRLDDKSTRLLVADVSAVWPSRFVVWRAGDRGASNVPLLACVLVRHCGVSPLEWCASLPCTWLSLVNNPPPDP